MKLAFDGVYLLQQCCYCTSRSCYTFRIGIRSLRINFYPLMLELIFGIGQSYWVPSLVNNLDRQSGLLELLVYCFWLTVYEPEHFQDGESSFWATVNSLLHTVDLNNGSNWLLVFVGCLLREQCHWEPTNKLTLFSLVILICMFSWVWTAAKLSIANFMFSGHNENFYH